MTKKSTAKTTRKGAQFNMEAVAALPTGAGSEGAILDALMNDLTGDDDGDAVGTVELLEHSDADLVGDPGEILESTAHPAGVDDLLDTVEEDADVIAARQAIYAAQAGTAGDDGSAPETAPDAIIEPANDKAAKKAARDAAREAKKAEREAKKAAQPPKPVRATSVTHKPGALLVAKLGTDWRDFLVLRAGDVASGDTLVIEKIQNDFVERMNDKDAIADKVREKMVMLLTWLKAGAPTDLNEVLKRTFKVLHAKGELTSGDKGNLQLDLLSKPYSMGTARSQANQMFMALPELGLTVKEKGRMVANPDSVLLPMINAKLGLV